MTSTLRSDRPWLDAVHDAIARRDFRRAETIFLQQLATTGDDPDLLAEYGVFCLRTGRADSACWGLAKADHLRPGQAPWWVQWGYASVETGAHAQAAMLFARAVASNPNDPAALYGLAQCQRRDAHWAQAAITLARALSAAGASDGLPIALQLADACHRAGDDAAAATHYRNLAATCPGQPSVWYAQACFWRETAHPDRALPLLERCLRHTPDEARVVLEHARCLRALGQPLQALASLQRLASQTATLPDYHVQIGECLTAPAQAGQRQQHWLAAIDLWIARGDTTPALALAKTLLADDPELAAGWHAMGRLQQARGDLAAAEQAWRKALARDAGMLEAAAGLALLLEGSNRLEDATQTVDQALSAIAAGRAHGAQVELQLARCKLTRRRRKFDESRDALSQIDALAPDATQRMHASFERGKLLDQSGDAQGAMAAFGLGNQIALSAWQHQHPGRNKILAGVELQLDLLRKGWRPQPAHPPTLQGHRDIAFLLGFPRSGTTLLNQVLDGHPAIHALEEKPPTQKMLDALQAMPNGYPHALPTLDAFDIHWLRQVYLAEAAHHGASDQAGLLLDKFPMHTTLAALLQRVFPQARFVFALRHPCDVVLSCFMQHFHLNNTMANFCSLADTVALYTRTMDLWQRWRELLPLQVHTIRYEDVVDDFDTQVAALCRFLGVAWQDDLRDFSGKALARGRIDTPSYEQVSRPIYRESRYRWLRYRTFLEPHLPALQPYIRRFGYADDDRP